MLSREAIVVVVIGIIVLTTAGVFVGIHIHNSDVKPGPKPNCPKPNCPKPNCPKPGPKPNCPKPGPKPNCPKPNCPKPGPKPNCPKPLFPCTCYDNPGGYWGTYDQCFYGGNGGEKPGKSTFSNLLCTNWSDTELFSTDGNNYVKFARHA